MSTLMRVRVFWQVPGPRLDSVTLDFQTNTAVSTTDLTQAAQAAYDAWTTQGLRARFSPNINMSRAEAFAYDVVASGLAPPKPPFKRQPTLGPIASVGALVPGTAGSAEGPPQLALVTTFRTDLSTKRTRGRIYLPPIPTGDYGSNGVVNAAAVAAMQAAITNYIGAIEGSAIPIQTFTHSVVSLWNGTPRNVQSYEVRDRIDTQRRRLLRALDV